MLRTPLALLSVLGLAFFTACNNTSAPAPVPTLEVSPLQISVLAGDAATALEAKVTNSNAAVLWSLEGAGTLSSLKGTATKYTPPAELNTASSAKITVVLEGTKLSQLVNIALTPKPTTYLTTVGTTVDLTQPTYAGSSKIRFMASLAPLGPTPFKKPARVSGSSTASVDQIEWKLTGPGKLDPVKGQFTDYTPPDEVMAKTQVTVAAQYQGRISTLNFFVTPKPVQPAPKLSISPSSATFTAGDAGQSFSATLENSLEPISWSLDGVGSLSSSTGKTVVYTPPSSVTKEEVVKLVARASSALNISTMVQLIIKPKPMVTNVQKLVGQLRKAELPPGSAWTSGIVEVGVSVPRSLIYPPGLEPIEVGRVLTSGNGHFTFLLPSEEQLPYFYKPFSPPADPSCKGTVELTPPDLEGTSIVAIFVYRNNKLMSAAEHDETPSDQVTRRSTFAFYRTSGSVKGEYTCNRGGVVYKYIYDKTFEKGWNIDFMTQNNAELFTRYTTQPLAPLELGVQGF